MKKLLGSIIIMLILSQPVSAESSYDVETVSIHIFQEYKDFETLSTYEDNNQDNEQLTTIDDLSDTMDLITNLLKMKNETIDNIQNTMNNKVKNKEIMSKDQILKFQEFSSYAREKNNELQYALKNINDKKDLKNMQEAVLQKNIDYDKIIEEIKDIQNSQNIAIASLTSVISQGNGVLDIL